MQMEARSVEEDEEDDDDDEDDGEMRESISTGLWSHRVSFIQVYISLPTCVC